MFNKNKIETVLKIKSRLNENYFIETLKKYNAVIAGSFVLSQYTPSPSFQPYDMDIYINEKYFDSFIIELLDKGIFDNRGFFTHGVVTCPTYDQSFFKKNGIKFKISGFLQLQQTFITDIMIIRDGINIKDDVVTNFDLSICEIWYDGNDIQATHEDHIMKKSGILRKEYHSSFFEGNKFIMSRIEKYSNRGFTIQLEKMDNYIISVHGIHQQLNKENTEESLVKNIIEKLIIEYIRPLSYDDNYLYNSPLPQSLDSKIKKCSKLDKSQRKVCYSKLLYLYCNSFHRYDITELYLNSRVFLGCKNDDINKYVIELKKHMIYNKKYLIEEEKEYPDNTIRSKKRRQKIKNIDSLLDFINTLDFKKLDNIQLLLHSIYSKYTIIKDNDYEMKPIVISEDISEINGYNIITLENSKVGEYLEENETNIVLINYKNDKINGDVCLMDRDSLETYILNLRDQWFYQCNQMNNLGSVMKATPYIKLPTNLYNIYVYWYDLIDMYLRNKKGYNVFIYKETDKVINYSISHHNAFNEDSNWVGANHCQDRSDFKVSKIYYMKKSHNKSPNQSANKSPKSLNKSTISSLEKSLLQHLNEKTANTRNSKVNSLSLKSSSKSSNRKIKSL